MFKNDAALAWGRAAALVVWLQRGVQKSLAGVAVGLELREQREAVWKPDPAHRVPAPHPVKNCRWPIARRRFGSYRRLLRPRCRDYFRCSSRILSIGAD